MCTHIYLQSQKLVRETMKLFCNFLYLCWFYFWPLSNIWPWVAVTLSRSELISSKYIHKIHLTRTRAESFPIHVCGVEKVSVWSISVGRMIYCHFSKGDNAAYERWLIPFCPQPHSSPPPRCGLLSMLTKDLSGIWYSHAAARTRPSRSHPF